MIRRASRTPVITSSETTEVFKCVVEQRELRIICNLYLKKEKYVKKKRQRM
jgi:hypothetical protein